MSERMSYKKLYNRLQYLPPCKDGYHWSIDANICGYSLCIVKNAGGGQYYTSSPMKGAQLADVIQVLIDMEYNKKRDLI